MSPDASGMRELETGREPWEAPPGWTWAALRDVTDPVATVDSRKRGDDKIKYIDVSALRAAKIERAQIVEACQAPSRARQLVFANDTLFSGVRVYLKNIALVDAAYDGAVASTAFCVLRPGAALDARYMYWCVNRQSFVNSLLPLQRGNSPPAVLDGDIKAQLIPVAPLAEQRRIVARIDELFAEIAEGEAALERARQGLDTWRRALLKAAVTGEMTRDWREANRPAETGADLLARIRARTHIRARKGLDATSRRGRLATGREPLDTSRLPGLPQGWTWARLGDLGEIVGGVTVDKKRVLTDPVEVPYLRVANVQRGYLDLAEIKTINVERQVACRLALKANDILLNEGGDRDKIGRGWVWQNEVSACIHQNHVFRVRLYDEGVNPYFVSHYANEMGRVFFIEKGKQTTNLASISLSKISELPVPVPPSAESRAIIDRLNETLSAELDIDHELTDAQTSLSAQRQAILKAAFAGRLVPQDPEDEPAAALLARLRKSETAATMRGRRRRADRRQLPLPDLSEDAAGAGYIKSH